MHSNTLVVGHMTLQEGRLALLGCPLNDDLPCIAERANKSYADSGAFNVRGDQIATDAEYVFDFQSQLLWCAGCQALNTKPECVNAISEVKAVRI